MANYFKLSTMLDDDFGHLQSLVHDCLSCHLCLHLLSLNLAKDALQPDMRSLTRAISTICVEMAA